MKVAVIIVAAGAGTRLGHSVPKAFVPLAGQPLLRHALTHVLACDQVGHVVIVAPSDHLAAAHELIHDDERCRVEVVAGGAERMDSVARGIAALRDDDEIVLVHDAARCLAPSALFARVADAVRAGHDAVVPGVAVVDTVKQVDDAGMVIATPPRPSLRAVQTPQGFAKDVLVRAHQQAREAGAGGSVTDDAGLVEAMGAKVLVVPGEPAAAKVTTAADLAVMERGWSV